MYRFDEYDLIIDARCEREFAEDHIPGAINLPVVNNEEYAEVGTLHRTDKMKAYLIGVAYSLKNISRYLDTVIASRPRRDRILVYCFRGGKRSRLWFDALDTIGYKVDRLPGGWKGYRRWVNGQLEERPRQFTYFVLAGPTGCGKTRLLDQLARAGAQVLDLEAVAAHRGSVIGAIPGISQPTQKYFDSLLLQQLLTFSTDRPVWVEAESKKIGNVQMPPALLNTMYSNGKLIRISAPMAQRVRLWREDYAHFEQDPAAFLAQLTHLRSLVGGKEFERWQDLTESGQIPELFERLMTVHYDPSYERSIKRNYPTLSETPLIELDELAPDALCLAAKNLIHLFH
ncbi:tRNA 2-selenouridine(34) synthase MnmH [Paraburkholderia sp. CNPSo 3157]|uniref:tRNA 2-selenouridine(34) synthase MnmH n=1 Tax=Paraburkholderia franconis TaxID=2654983 RepID=A0A7X1NDV6_9BURK|nr:tRNA 2-selenouridine(34) synthase MnmH [Paraburkholderia franconis]MPW20059.1 tRNA 2-selenouridine(34) synthase MnmH [Paraburkholderia franconis]